MGFKEVMGKLFAAREVNDRDDIPDDVTTDKFLRSLRRQRRIQLEELEKAELKKQIKEFEEDRMRKFLFGFKESRKTMENRERFKKMALMRKKVDILKQKNNFKLKKLKTRKDTGFMNRGLI